MRTQWAIEPTESGRGWVVRWKEPDEFHWHWVRNWVGSYDHEQATDEESYQRTIYRTKRDAIRRTERTCRVNMGFESSEIQVMNKKDGTWKMHKRIGFDADDEG
jgi:hypothetical protein